MLNRNSEKEAVKKNNPLEGGLDGQRVEHGPKGHGPGQPKRTDGVGRAIQDIDAFIEAGLATVTSSLQQWWRCLHASQQPRQ